MSKNLDADKLLDYLEVNIGKYHDMKFTGGVGRAYICDGVISANKDISKLIKEGKFDKEESDES